MVDSKVGDKYEFWSKTKKYSSGTCTGEKLKWQVVLGCWYLAMSSVKNILSWANHESERQQLFDLAIKFRDADLLLEKVCGNAMNATVNAWKHPNNQHSIEARASADAFAALLAYNSYLILELGLNYHLVRQVSSAVLNPSSLEIESCQNNIKEEIRKAERTKTH